MKPHRFPKEGAEWLGQPGASQEELSSLKLTVPRSTPDLLFDILSTSNGGEGPLALPPQNFMLDDCKTISESINDSWTAGAFPELLFFGSNGGLERIAIDLRNNGSIVMVDPIAGISSSVKISENLESFLENVGFEYPDLGHST